MNMIQFLEGRTHFKNVKELEKGVFSADLPQDIAKKLNLPQTTVIEVTELNNRVQLHFNDAVDHNNIINIMK